MEERPEAFYDIEKLSEEDMEAFEKQYKKIDKDKSGKIDKKEWMAFISEVSGLGENPFEKAKNANQEFKDLVFEVKKEKE